MRIARRELIRVVIFAIICLIGTVVLGAKLANTRLFADTYELSAEFENASGVLAGDAVKIAGVDVGRVTETEIRNGLAVVRFTVDQGIELPQDTRVGIRWRNVLGQRFLYVYPGTGPKDLNEGDTIPVAQTQDVADIGEFLNRVGPILRAIDPQQANRFLDAMNTALAGNEANVRSLLDSGARLSKDLQSRDDEIASLIDNADQILAAYASQDRNIESIFDNLDNVSGVLARRTQDINSLVTNLADVQTQMEDLLKTSHTDIDATIDSLDVVTNTLARNRENLGRTLATTPMGIANYFQTSGWGEFFNVRIVKILVQDRASNDLVVQGETDDQHGDSGGGTGGGNGGGGGGGNGGGGSSSGDGTENVGAILRYVLSGDEA